MAGQIAAITFSGSGPLRIRPGSWGECTRMPPSGRGSILIDMFRLSCTELFPYERVVLQDVPI